LLGDALVEWCGRQPPLVAVGPAVDHADLLRLYARHRPELVVLEIDGDAWEPVRFLPDAQGRRPYTIGLHHGLRPESAARLHDAGLVNRLVDFAAGLASFAAAVNDFLGQLKSTDSSGFRLTPREREILMLLSEGDRVAAIAELLGVTRRTVENHKRHIFAKLAVHSTSHAVAIAASAGLFVTRQHVSTPVRDRSGSVRIVTLTSREREILALADRGFSTKQTARTLQVSAKTVENIWRHLFGKLGVHDRAEALAAVHRWGYDEGSGS
jgi:DNA-binding NarL/FixJ family response regulator